MNEPNSIIPGLLTDYVTLLAKEHPTAAKVVQAYANAEMARQQQIGQSQRQPPNDHNPDQ